MKNFNIKGIHWKIALDKGSQKTNRGELPKWGTWTVSRFKEGGLAKMRGGVLRSVDSPMHLMYLNSKDTCTTQSRDI